MTADDLYNTISKIQDRKRADRKVHEHCLRIADLFNGLKEHSISEIDFALRELKDAGRIEAGRTINDTWIKTK